MSSLKCPNCGLRNFSTADECRRCNASLANAMAFATDGLSLQQLDQGIQTATINPPVAGQPFTPPYAPGAGYLAPGMPQGQYQSHPSSTEPAAYAGVPYEPYAGVTRPYAYTPPAPAKRREGMAITSLVMGIVGFFTCGLAGIGSLIGLVLGSVAFIKAHKDPDQYGGSAAALTGMITNGLFVVFIPIILAIAIPNILASRMAANEAAAIARLNRIATAEATYHETTGEGRKYATLRQLVEAGLIDDVTTQYGYRFEISTDELTRYSGNSQKFDAFATPVSYGSTGKKSFYVSSDFIVRGADKHGHTASASDPTVSTFDMNTYGHDPEKEWEEPAQVPTQRRKRY